MTSRIMASTGEQNRMRLWLEDHLDMGLPLGTQYIGLEKNGLIKGVIGFCFHINKSILMHAAGLNKEWVTRDLLFATFDYPFNQLSCETVIGQVGSKNIDALRFNEHLGFKVACKIPKAHQDGDLVIMTMARDKCKWLKIKSALKEAA